MMVLTSNAPIIVTRAVVTGMTNVAYASFLKIYGLIEKDSSLSEVQDQLLEMHIRTDLELLGALLSDMKEIEEKYKSERVCLEHLHDSLGDMNVSLKELDDVINENNTWFRSVKVNATLIQKIKMNKKCIDHHILRFVQLHQVLQIKVCGL